MAINISPIQFKSFWVFNFLMKSVTVASTSFTLTLVKSSLSISFTFFTINVSKVATLTFSNWIKMSNEIYIMSNIPL